MPARAAGFRPSASQAADAAFPWPCAASPDAMAIANPEVIATQFVPPAAPAPVCANTGTARKENIIITNSTIKIFRILFPLEYESPQEVVDAVPICRRPHAEGRCQAPGVRSQG